MDHFYTLSNGNSIPKIGFGTWQAKGHAAVAAVKDALSLGYRHIDTAASYGNEAEVGQAISQSGVAREDVFVCSKLKTTYRGYENALTQFEKTLQALDMDYIDLYLIHWPANAKMHSDWEQINSETWRAFEEIYRAGKARNIGLSNFLPHHLQSLLKTAELCPVVNQIEFHPGYFQPDVLAFCQQNDILVEAWSPLGRGNVLQHRTLVQLAAVHGCTTAQLCLAWALAKGVLPLPKSVTPDRIRENIGVYDIQLSSTELKKIDSMLEFGFSGMHPDEVEF